MNEDLQKIPTISYSIKWSFISELFVKIISPITSMILARLIAPEAFGVVSSVLIITAFAEMFTDGGFQQYLIRHQFKSDNEFREYTSVVFWSNLGISFCFMIGIFFLAPILAGIVGTPEHADEIRVYSVILLLTSYSGTQYAVFKKQFKFKELGKLRIFGKMVPLFTTIPMAALGFGVWAIMIGNIVSEALIDLLLYLKSDVKIKFYYSFSCFSKMLHYSIGVLLNSVVAWTMTNLSIFMIGAFFSVYDQGLFQMSFNLVGQITSIITASTMGVFLSDLSAKQIRISEFNETIYKYQKGIGLVSIPLGVGFFVFRRFVTGIFLGDLYSDAVLLVGILGFVTCECITFIEIGQNICWAIGKPYYVVISNVIQVVLIFLVLIINKANDFAIVGPCICMLKFQLGLTHILLAKKASGFFMARCLFNLLPFYISSAVMGVVGYISLGLFGADARYSVLGIILSIVTYGICLMLFSDSRRLLLDFGKQVSVKLKEMTK